MEITEQIFANTIANWTKDVQREALALFRAGVAHDMCMQTAIKIVEGKDIQRARSMAKFGVVPPQ